MDALIYSVASPLTTSGHKSTLAFGLREMEEKNKNLSAMAGVWRRPWCIRAILGKDAIDDPLSDLKSLGFSMRQQIGDSFSFLAN
jgi:hypothetical protein